jgi:hypothetical protein
MAGGHHGKVPWAVVHLLAVVHHNLLVGVSALIWWYSERSGASGATNPDRYLKNLRGLLFPIVEVVNKIGDSTRGMGAGAVERCLKWALTHAEEMQEAVTPREESLVASGAG